MKNFFNWSLPGLFLLALLPLAIQVIFHVENAAQTLYCVYFFQSLLSFGNLCGYLSYKCAARSFSRWSILYVPLNVLLLMFNVLLSMFIDAVF